MTPIFTISRFWNHPKIMTVIWTEGISLSIDLEDFRKALHDELKEMPTKTAKKLWFKYPILDKEVFHFQIDAALNRICDKIQLESTEALKKLREQKKEATFVSSPAAEKLSVEEIKDRLKRRDHAV